MDRHLAASLDAWITTPPEDRYPACECEDECECDNAEDDAALQEWAEYDMQPCTVCRHPRYQHGDGCLGNTDGKRCVCWEYGEEVVEDAE